MVMPRFGWRERVRPAHKLRHSGDIGTPEASGLIKQVIGHPVETLAPQIVFGQGSNEALPFVLPLITLCGTS